MCVIFSTMPTNPFEIDKLITNKLKIMFFFFFLLNNNQRKKIEKFKFWFLALIRGEMLFIICRSIVINNNLFEYVRRIRSVKQNKHWILLFIIFGRHQNHFLYVLRICFELEDRSKATKTKEREKINEIKQIACFFKNKIHCVNIEGISWVRCASPHNLSIFHSHSGLLFPSFLFI